MRFYSSKFLILMINFLLGKKISDPMSGFFIFKKNQNFLNQIEIIFMTMDLKF